MIRAVPLAAAVASIALAGCGSPARAPDPPGATLVLLENRVDEPCELTSVSARIDDRPLERTTIAPAGAPAVSLDRPVLSPGAHTVSISAAATCKGADTDSVLQVTQPVYMTGGGGKITITLTRDPTAASGLAARLTVAGGDLLAPRADGGDLDCRGRLPIDGAICRTEAALTRARERRDVILALCLSEKLREMRLVADAMTRHGDEPRDAALQGEAESAARRVLALAAEAEHCIGETMMEADGIFIERSPPRALAAFR